MNDKELLYYIWLSQIKKVGPAQKKVLLDRFGGAENLYRASAEDVEMCCAEEPALCNVSEGGISALCFKDVSLAERTANYCGKNGIAIITCADEGYPELLKEISDPPVLLYARGRTELLKTRCVAVVGTRRSSPYGRWAASEIGKRIAKAGGTVVSGMAEGIDSMAQKACAEAGGDTIAVFGTGVDICFPVSNRALYEKIKEKGLMISEYAPLEAGFPQNFPERNRIISGLSQKVIVVEGAIKSGSMITANLASEQGRDVFAVPGNINQPNSVGVNRLISDGAYPITSLDGLCALLGLEDASGKKRLAKLSKEERKLCEIIFENPGITCDGLCLMTGERASDVSSLLCALEIKGLVRTEGSRCFAV